jgi:hypothetical protein
MKGSSGSVSVVVIVTPEVDTNYSFQSSEGDEIIELRRQRVALDSQESLATGGEGEQVDLAELERTAQQSEVLLEAREDLAPVSARTPSGRKHLAAGLRDAGLQQSSFRLELGPGNGPVRLGPRSFALTTLHERDR